MSPSVGRRSPVRDRSDSPARGRRSPRRRSPSRRERSPLRRRSSPRARSPVGTSSRARSPAKEKEKPLSRARSPKRPWSSSPTSGSPSPRIKRLRRAQMEKEGDRVSDRECGRNSGREVDKERDSREVDRVSDRERVRNSNREVDKERCNREISVDRSDRRSARGKKEVDRVSDREREKNITREGDRERHNREVSVDRNERRSRHQRSASPVGRGYSNRHSSHSPSRVARGGVHDEVTIRRGEDDRDDNDSVARMKAAEESLEAKEKQKPSFELSGKLAAETNRVKGVTLLFNEPSDARKPDVRWRLYVFKGGEVLNEPLYIHRQSCYLFGRERRVADIPTDHPSCSKQHAVIQFRQVEVEKADGMLSKQSRVCHIARELSLGLGGDLICGSGRMLSRNYIFLQQLEAPNYILLLQLKISVVLSSPKSDCFLCWTVIFNFCQIFHMVLLHYSTSL